MSSFLYDAHNHLQDSRFPSDPSGLIQESTAQGVRRMVVNGTRESDWARVRELAEAHPEILPSFGCHPWFLDELTPKWERRLTECLEQVPAGVGEVGLDRWKRQDDFGRQQEVFIRCLNLAANRDLPVSIHCLEAWGALFDILKKQPLPRRGFLLHSYSGPIEMVRPFANLGAYFSFPGYFAHERKQRQRRVFLEVPPERLLVETDAPDQLPPEELRRFPLEDATTGKPLNHPANLKAVYEFLADFLGEPMPSFTTRVESNFLRLFGNIEPRSQVDNSLA